MFKKFWKIEVLFCLMILIGLGVVYRDVFFGGKVAFSSNLLVSFYSPWVTQKFDEYPNGVPNKPIGGNDQVRMFYPYRTFINQSFHSGEFPLWNPYNFSGSPIIANFQSAVFYPPNLLYFVLPQIDAWQLLVLLQPLLGTFFMYRYLRLFISQPVAAMIGAVGFGFSGFILAWSQENAVVGQAALWLPAILYCTERYISRFSARWYVMLCLALACAILSGHLQTTFYIFVVVFAYGIYRSQKRAYFVSAFVVSMLLCAVQLLPSWEAYGESARSSSSSEPFLEKYLMPVTHFINAMSPDIFGNPGSYNFFGRGFYQESIFYIGIIPLLFAIVAAVKMRTHTIIRFFMGVAVISYLLGVNWPFTQWFLRLPIPLVSTFSPSRIFFVTGSSLAVLGAFGCAYWLEHGLRAVWKVVLITVASMVLLLVVSVVYLHYSSDPKIHVVEPINNYIFHKKSHIRSEDARVALRNSVVPVMMLGGFGLLFLVSSRFKHAPFLVVLVTFLGQLYFLNKYVVIGEKKFLYPDHFIFSDIQKNQRDVERFLSFGWPIVGNLGLQKRVYSPDGIDPVFSHRYGELLYAAKRDGRYTAQIPWIESNLSEYGENLNIISNPYRQRLIDLLGVRMVYNYEKNYHDISVLPKIFPAERYILKWKRDDWQVYENKNVYPRAFLVDSYSIERDPQKSMDRIFDPATDLRKSVVLEKKPDGVDVVTDGSIDAAKATIVSYAPQKVVVKVASSQARLLFLSDVFYPGWVARVDGVTREIYRANYAFRAVVVPKGEHTVTFTFESGSFRWGALISALSLLGVLGLGYRFRG